MENPFKMDDLGGKPTIFGNIHLLVIPTAFFVDFFEQILQPGDLRILSFLSA